MKDKHTGMKHNKNSPTAFLIFLVAVAAMLYFFYPQGVKAILKSAGQMLHEVRMALEGK